MPESPVRAKTPWFIKNVMNPILKRTGALPILTFRGRRSGKTFSTPINVVDLEGTQYLCSPRGETNWSRNLRANAECSLTVKRQERRFRATEVPTTERPRVIDAYLARWGNQTRSQFQALPDPTDHPTFRLDPVS